LSLLLLGPPEGIGDALIARLHAEADQVRVVEDDAARAQRWAEAGAHVARGSPADADLVERAAHGIRSIVVLSRAGAALGDIVAAAVAAARAGDARLVVCAGRVDADVYARVLEAEVEHVVLRTGRRPLGPGRAARRDAAVAAAIDAADDLQGSPRLDLDLRVARDWERLGLSPPASAGGASRG
jgi:hypothetical protein